MEVKANLRFLYFRLTSVWWPANMTLLPVVRNNAFAAVRSRQVLSQLNRRKKQTSRIPKILPILSMLLNG